jgi:hypothetical protein
VRYSQGDESWGFEHWSVAWRLIKRVRNATSENAKKHMSGQNWNARQSVNSPISGVRKSVTGTIEIGERDDPSCEAQARHRSCKTAVCRLWPPRR